MCLWYWTAASETHQRESNTFIIQLNNRSMKDRSFSRKIESERSFFVSESFKNHPFKVEINTELCELMKSIEKEGVLVPLLARQVGESVAQIKRYIRLTNLIPKILAMVDEGKIAFTIGVELSYLSEEESGMYTYVRAFKK